MKVADIKDYIQDSMLAPNAKNNTDEVLLFK